MILLYYRLSIIIIHQFQIDNLCIVDMHFVRFCFMIIIIVDYLASLESTSNRKILLLCTIAGLQLHMYR